MTLTGPSQPQPFHVQLCSPPYPFYPFPVKHFPAQPAQASPRAIPRAGAQLGGFCSRLVLAQRGPEKPREHRSDPPGWVLLGWECLSRDNPGVVTGIVGDAVWEIRDGAAGLSRGEEDSVQLFWDTNPGNRDESCWVDMSTLIPVWRFPERADPGEYWAVQRQYRPCRV